MSGTYVFSEPTSKTKNTTPATISSKPCSGMMAARVLALGANVILDFGFWSQNEREDYRLRAERIGAGSQVHFLHVPEETLLARLTNRNAHLPPGTFLIPEEKIREYIALFEAPTEAELQSHRAARRLNAKTPISKFASKENQRISQSKKGSVLFGGHKPKKSQWRNLRQEP